LAQGRVPALLRTLRWPPSLPSSPFLGRLFGAMSYSTLDRFGGISTTYAHGRGGGPTASGGKSWWPDFGPGTHDFSSQDKSHPTETIFEKIVKPANWSQNARPASSSVQPVASQFRHPVPAREAMLHKAEPSAEAKYAAHAVTERQSALRRMEVRQRRVDAWMGPAPIRMSAAALQEALLREPTQLRVPEGPRRSRSEAAVRDLSTSSASEASRAIYEMHGYTPIGRSKPSIGSSGVRRHTPLSQSTMLYQGEVSGTHALDDSGGRSRRSGPRKPSKQWQTCPDSSYVWDPQSFLPVPRGGWNAQMPTRWPEVEATGKRNLDSSAGFDKSLPMVADFTHQGAVAAQPA